MGLPGSGKTTLAKRLFDLIGGDVVWFNADVVRKQYDDWDFTHSGRMRQALRMRQLSDNTIEKYKIVDFVAPLKEMRDIYDADYTIWVDTISGGRFEDTNKMFEPPEKFDVRVTTQDCDFWAEYILGSINRP